MFTIRRGKTSHICILLYLFRVCSLQALQGQIAAIDRDILSRFTSSAAIAPRVQVMTSTVLQRPGSYSTDSLFVYVARGVAAISL